MSKLPEWIVRWIKCYPQDSRLTEALSIAWEALDTWPICEARRHCACSNVRAYRKDAMRQLEELGEGISDRDPSALMRAEIDILKEHGEH